MREFRGRTLVLAACALLAVLASVISCARGNSTESAGSGLPKYYAAEDLLTAVTVRQRTDRTAALRLSGHVDAGGPAAEVAGDGALRVEQSGLAAQFTQTVTTDGQAQSAAMLVLPGGQVYRQDEAGWVRIDQAASGTPEKQWATVAANLADTADPTANLARYRDAALVADAVDDTVGGVQAVRYLVVIDLVRAAEQEPDPAVAQALRGQVESGLTRISSTLWIDAANRPLRSEARQSLPGIGTLTLTADYRDWGAPVTITTP
ncbi:hypothetical protein [Pseudonocardia oroxyli]|uniref:Lipoprotein LprG n=1 Tax=Pseudonocardia oroxyli TaxID=366584 RepID=A0A1G7NK57_PSEOR|nr:hypothetical protein [Pseudonocardia oroxyli]SDF74287.1 hypothetical protein SAMN05216377_106265 [Pseudonocardia oroxyli]